MKKTRIIQLCFLLFAVAFAGCKGKSGSEQAGGAFTPGELLPKAKEKRAFKLNRLYLKSVEKPPANVGSLRPAYTKAAA